jgi:hypothetical protein
LLAKSDEMLDGAFAEARRRLDEILERLGVRKRELQPEGGLPDGSQPMRTQGGNNGGGRPPSRVLDELGENSRQVIQSWSTEIQIRVANLLERGDNAIKEVIEQVTTEIASSQALTKVTRLLDAMASKPALPANVKKGKFFARGNVNSVFEVEGHSNLLYKPGKAGSLTREAKATMEQHSYGLRRI